MRTKIGEILIATNNKIHRCYKQFLPMAAEFLRHCRKD